MEVEKFLSIDDQSISLRQVMGYLQSSGELPRFLQRILYQHILTQELESRQDLEVDPQQVEQATIDFRLQNKLNDREQFERWLQSQGMNDAQFRNQMLMALKVGKLKTEVIGSKAEAYFNQNKAMLDQVVLSRIVVAEPSTAEDLRAQIVEGKATFEDLAQQHSLTNDSALKGVMGAIAMGQLPETIREQLLGKNPGELVGPIEAEGRYTLLRIEQWLPASFENKLKRQLQDQVFDGWVQEKLKDKKIQLHL